MQYYSPFLTNFNSKFILFSDLAVHKEWPEWVQIHKLSIGKFPNLMKTQFFPFVPRGEVVTNLNSCSNATQQNLRKNGWEPGFNCHRYFCAAFFDSLILFYSEQNSLLDSKKPFFIP